MVRLYKTAPKDMYIIANIEFCVSCGHYLFISESRRIEQAGGYQFTVTNIPNAFVFNSPQS